jgi:4-hydroxy-4-methyl-2-oxoglutarate aldolase
VPGGHVLVLATGCASTYGYFGEVLATAAIHRGAVGLVTDGGVRDVLAVERLGFAVFAAGAALRGTTKAGPGATGCSVTLADVTISPGDWIVADVDGVVAIRASQLPDVVHAGEARAAKEQHMLKSLRDGRTTADLLSLDLGKVQRNAFSTEMAAATDGQPDSIDTRSTTT